MRRRRKTEPLPPHVRSAFDAVAALVDAAQRALLAAVPTSRDPGIPLGEALGHFSRALDSLEAAMPSWRDEQVAHEWTKCSEALAEARAQAGTLRLSDDNLTFEQLNARIGDILYPLESFADVERDLRRR
jgi:hypothetical protein